MADNFKASDLDERPRAADEIAGILYQRVKVCFGADNSSSDVSTSNGLPVNNLAGTAAIGDVGMQYRANATGGATRYHLISANTTNAAVVKASAGRLIGWSVYNDNAATRYVKFHNQTTTPTAGSGVVMTLAIPSKQVREMQLPGGIGFATGIAITTTTGIADNDSAAVAANDLSIDLFYA